MRETMQGKDNAGTIIERERNIKPEKWIAKRWRVNKSYDAWRNNWQRVTKLNYIRLHYTPPLKSRTPFKIENGRAESERTENVAIGKMKIQRWTHKNK